MRLTWFRPAVKSGAVAEKTPVGGSHHRTSVEGGHGIGEQRMRSAHRPPAVQSQCEGSIVPRCTRVVFYRLRHGCQLINKLKIHKQESFLSCPIMLVRMIYYVS